MTALTQDAFLGGRLTVQQPAEGYRAGADPVLLAAAVPAVAGESALELGCGAGVAMLCLLCRVPGLSVTGVERDPDMAALARENLALNGLEAEVAVADIAAPPAKLRARSFDHVLMNPPFFDRLRGSISEHAGREAGRGEETPFAVWVDAAVRRLGPRGRLTMIQRAERLSDCLAAIGSRLGGVTVLPLAPREGRAAKLVLITARKGTWATFRLAAPFVLHEGPRHEDGAGGYAPAARRILRDGEGLDIEGLIPS